VTHLSLFVMTTKHFCKYLKGRNSELRTSGAKSKSSKRDGGAISNYLSVIALTDDPLMFGIRVATAAKVEGVSVNKIYSRLRYKK
jgi:hypothetical protein